MSVWSFPNVLLFLIGGASPLLAAMVLAGLAGGRERLPGLGCRLIDVRRISVRWQTLLIVWVCNGTSRSIPGVLVLHGMMNFTGEFLGLAPEPFPFMLAGNSLAATVLVVGWRRPRGQAACARLTGAPPDPP